MTDSTIPGEGPRNINIHIPERFLTARPLSLTTIDQMPDQLRYLYPYCLNNGVFYSTER